MTGPPKAPQRPSRNNRRNGDAGHDQAVQPVHPDQPDTPENTQQPAETPGPVSVAPDLEAAKGVPHISAHPKFWQADHPAGFDDPAWRQTVPFSTFDDVMDGGGAGPM